MNILVTGAGGFIARTLVAELEASPHRHNLYLMDRVAPHEMTVFVPGSHERVACPLETSWPFVQAEVNDLAAMDGACRGMDAVIHLAAAVSGFPEQGVNTFHANACGTFVALDAARRAGVSRFLCASSINAFGTFYWRLSKTPVVYTAMPLTEEFPPIPEDPYSLSKLVNEQTCAAFSRAYGFTTAACRFAGVWTNEMFENALTHGLAPTRQWADDLYSWVHVGDIARGLRQALECEALPQHGVYTLGAGDTTCLEPTMDVLERFRPDLAATLARPLEGHEPLLSIDKAHRTFGYKPMFRLHP